MLTDDLGTPVFWPTVYAVAELRNRHRAANTITNALASLRIFQNFLEDRTIDLTERLDGGRLLELGEIEEMVRTCRADCSNRAKRPALVTAEVCATRLRTIRHYLEWRVKSKLLARDFIRSAELQHISDLTVGTINARIPPRGTDPDPREGLAPEAIQCALHIIDAKSPANPWRTEHARVRNELIWSLLYHLGMRRGELLGIRIRHINLRKGTLIIARQADNPDDPRRRQPNAKTLARELAISEALQMRLSEYILKHRRGLGNAHRHDFLLVSESGDPLSISAINKVFRVLRTKFPELPNSLTPHSLRHTWNDMFSLEAEEHNIDAEKEKKIRSYQMGWKPTSSTAAVYTKRFIRKKAQEVSLSLQNKLMSRDPNA